MDKKPEILVHTKLENHIFETQMVLQKGSPCPPATILVRFAAKDMAFEPRPL